MERALKIIDQLHLVSIVCVFDQAIYSKGEIKWKEAKKFQNCVLMLGIFHFLMMYMGILNKQFSEAGLKDALIHSSIIAEGSIDSVLRGKCYNRCIRLYKTAYESLLHSNGNARKLGVTCKNFGCHLLIWLNFCLMRYFLLDLEIGTCL